MVTYYTPALYGSGPSVGYELKYYIENSICYVNVRLVYGAAGNKFGGYKLYYNFEFTGAYTGGIGSDGNSYFETESTSVENSTGVSKDSASGGYISNYEGYSFSFPVTKDESYDDWSGANSNLNFRIYRSGGTSSSTGHMGSAITTGQVPWMNLTVYSRNIEGENFSSVDIYLSTGEHYVVTPNDFTSSGDNARTICGITGGTLTAKANLGSKRYEFVRWVKREGRYTGSSSVVTYHAENPYVYEIIADRDHKAILRPESAKKAGTAHIFDGTEWQMATAYVFDGEEWRATRPSVYSGTEWDG